MLDDQLGLERGRLHFDDDVAVAAVGDLGSVDPNVGEVGGGQAGSSEVEAAVEQLDVAEGCAVGDTIDRLENRVDLELVGRDFIPTQPPLIGRPVHETLKFEQQAVDFLQ